MTRTTEEYDANDRRQLREYMQQHGLTTPKEVWLITLRAFLDVDMGQDVRTWTEWLMKKAYPTHARWFIRNMTVSYLCFCSPFEATDEFILTQNAYDVFEGSCSHLAGADWHTFAPINEKLIIVLRNTWQGGASAIPLEVSDVLPAASSTVVEIQTENNKVPPAAVSCLEDLPVARPVPSYPTPISSIDASEHQYNVADAADAFEFTFFYLPHKYAQLINSIFLEQAIQTNTIAYKSRTALCTALEAYLSLDNPHFKQTANVSTHLEGATCFYRDHHGLRLEHNLTFFRRRAYLSMLERVAAQLGSTTVAKTSPNTTRVELTMPHFPPSVLDRYKKLGKPFPQPLESPLIPHKATTTSSQPGSTTSNRPAA